MERNCRICGKRATHKCSDCGALYCNRVSCYSKDVHKLTKPNPSPNFYVRYFQRIQDVNRYDIVYRPNGIDGIFKYEQSPQGLQQMVDDHGDKIIDPDTLEPIDVLAMRRMIRAWIYYNQLETEGFYE